MRSCSFEGRAMLTDKDANPRRFRPARCLIATFDATAIQTLDKHFDILLKASSQISSRNLDSSERFYLGGARGVRAYPQGEASGDEGILGSLELRYHTSVPGLTVSTYYDAGHVTPMILQNIYCMQYILYTAYSISSEGMTHIHHISSCEKPIFLVR